MRKTMISLLLAAVGAIGLAGSTAVEARDARIYVDLGDVAFSYGRPYYRYNREPLYVVYERGYPRYYRTGPARYYAHPPRYGYGARYEDDDYYRYRYRDPYRYDWRYRYRYYDPYWNY